MNKMTVMKSFALFAGICLIASLNLWGQPTTIFLETLDMKSTPSGTQSISNTNFDNENLTFTGNADTRTTTESTGYLDASGGRNVFFGTASGVNARHLLIEGINTQNYDAFIISFGMNSSASQGLTLEYSEDGVSFTEVVYPAPSAAGWKLITLNANLPKVENLRLRFSKDDGLSYRLDDIKLIGLEPNSTSLPYMASFSDDLEDTYVYSVEGAAGRWEHSTFGAGFAQANGFVLGLADRVEDHWLVFPAIDFDAAEGNVFIEFITRVRFNLNEDGNNFFKLLYSSDYAGVGNPTTAIWNEILFDKPVLTETETNSGKLDLSAVSGDNVYLAFRYRYEEATYAQWQVRNVNIYEGLADEPENHPSAFEANADSSTEITLTWTDAVPAADGYLIKGSSVSYEDINSPTDEEPEDNSLLVQNVSEEVEEHTFGGLNPGVTYYFKIFPYNGAGPAINYKTDNAPQAQATTEPPPGVPYTQDFIGFDFPSDTKVLNFGDDNQWSFESTGNELDYKGDWGSGTAAGFRGNNNVLGYQHTGNTGVFVANLSLINNTGETIEALEVSYLGRVARETEGRSPVWTVFVDGDEVPTLSYSTAGGTDEVKSAIISGLNIANGEIFTIVWSSDGNVGTSGARRQIGIADVSVQATAPPPLPNPVFSIAAGVYYENQTVYIDNYEDDYQGSGITVHYTLNGDGPTVTDNQYNHATGIILEDGTGPITLKAIAIDNGTASGITTAEYIFPKNVANIAAFRAGDNGTLYRITGEVVVLHRDGFRNRHFVRDGSGALTIWDADGNVTSEYNDGDGVENFIGVKAMKNSNGLVVLEAETDPGDASNTGLDVTPIVITLNDLSLDHTGNLVTIQQVDFEDSGKFETLNNYSITDPSTTGTILFRTDFTNADYIDEDIPQGLINLTAIVGGFGSNPQVTARSLADFELVPILNANPTILSNLDYLFDDGPSTPQPFEITGTNFTDQNVRVSAPANFELSEVEAGPFSTDDIVLTEFDGTAVEVFTRLAADLEPGKYTGTVTLTVEDGGNGSIEAFVAVSGQVADVFDIPYVNDFRTIEDNNRAVLQGFEINDANQVTDAGGYMRIFPDGYIETPTIDFTEYQYILFGFDARRFGGDGGQKLSVKVSANNGLSYEIIETIDIVDGPSGENFSYISYVFALDLTGDLNVGEGKIKIEMTDGTQSTRFRDFFILDATGLAFNTDLGVFYQTIQEAVDNANQGDRIVFQGNFESLDTNTGPGVFLAPGSNPPGCGIFTSTFTLTAGDVLEIDINGPVPCNDHDQIQVGTVATLGDASLEVVLGFAPAMNDEFVIMTYGTSIVGEFAQEGEVTAIYDGQIFTFAIDYETYDQITLQVTDIQEILAFPVSNWSVMLLMGLILAFVTFRIRRTIF